MLGRECEVEEVVCAAASETVAAAIGAVVTTRGAAITVLFCVTEGEGDDDEDPEFS